ncbi:MAG: hypothetical protein IJ308_07715 [Clostridia bacterium]|nr:hypothetical protein [Clostridia bacterium]
MKRFLIVLTLIFTFAFSVFAVGCNDNKQNDTPGEDVGAEWDENWTNNH